MRLRRFSIAESELSRFCGNGKCGPIALNEVKYSHGFMEFPL